jgi:hypothetical protein
MNVDDAMETAAAYLAAHEQEQEPLFDSEEVAITLAKEVERLLAVNQIFEAANVRLATELERVQAELAAAKAASVLPTEVIGCYSFGPDVKVICECADDADRLSGWIRERMKENSI